MRSCLLSVAAALLSYGCASTPFQEIVPQNAWSRSDSSAITVPIGIVADTQFHESRGVASRYAGLSGDEFIDVTVRTGQQVIGAGDVLQRAMQLSANFPLVLHAGDALDVSCETEWWLFKQVMLDARGEPGPSAWLFTFGNHDGYHTGNIFPKDSGLYVTNYWSNMCNVGQRKTVRRGKEENLYGHMPKDRLVGEYLKMLEPLRREGTAMNGCNEAETLCWSAYVSKSSPWTSFLVQRVLLPAAPGAMTPIYALLLDSSDYDERPYVFSTLAGVQGAFSVRQLKAARDLIQGLPQSARYFFVTHHPASDWAAYAWSDLTRRSWMNLLEDSRSLRFLVSAHTHKGSFRAYHEQVGALIEMNTGSLADAPIYLRSLQFHQGPNGELGVSSTATALTTADSACNQVIIPPSRDGLTYDVDSQQSENDRASSENDFIRRTKAFFSAAGHFFKFWEAKHMELRPQLLAYADVVELTMPPDAKIEYVWTTLEGGGNKSLTLEGGPAVAEELRANANCKSGQRRCSVQAKGNLLRAVDEYYWSTPGVPRRVKDMAHRMRLCLALDAAETSLTPQARSQVDALQASMRETWSIQLGPVSHISKKSASARGERGLMSR